MVAKKQDSFTKEHIALAGFAHALSHPARIAIVTLLQERQEACCGDIVEALPLAQATVSQHLRALRDADLLNAKEDGQKVCYSIKWESIRSFCHSFQCTLGTASQEEPLLDLSEPMSSSETPDNLL